MISRTRLSSALAVLFLTACGGGGGGNNNSSTPNTSAGAAPPVVTPKDSFPANVQPVGLPPYVCVAPGTATQAVMQKLNAFWQSNVVACGCNFVLLANICARNGFVTPTGYGYIYYDASFLDELDARTGSPLPADYFMAHEFGHNIQLALNLQSPGKFHELQADCLGGYYVGFQARKGAVNPSEVLRTFQFACSIGDPFVSDWWTPGTHGSCADRVAALQRGFDGYQAAKLPGQACP